MRRGLPSDVLDVLDVINVIDVLVGTSNGAEARQFTKTNYRLP